jgi:hypothetical protein
VPASVGTPDGGQQPPAEGLPAAGRRRGQLPQRGTCVSLRFVARSTAPPRIGVRVSRASACLTAGQPAGSISSLRRLRGCQALAAGSYMPGPSLSLPLTLNPRTCGPSQIVALDMKTGAVKWATPVDGPDAWNAACLSDNPAVNDNCPAVEGPDFDVSARVAKHRALRCAKFTCLQSSAFLMCGMHG